MWPTEPPIEGQAREEAEREFIRASVTWTADHLFEVRKTFAKLLRFRSPQAFESGLQDLILTLRTAFPSATIDVLRIDRRTLADPLLIRVLALLPLLPVPELIQILERSPLDASSSLHFFRPEPHFELVANLGFPRTHAFGIRCGPEAYFIIDYGQDITLDPLEWSERRARDVGANLLSPPGEELRTKSFPDTSPATRHFLRAWLTGRLSFLFSHLTDLHSAAAPNSNLIDTMGLWKDLLTLRDIVGLTQLVATASDPTVIRMLFFDVIDRYGQLGGRPKRNADAILSDQFINDLADGLDPGLHDLRTIVRDYLLDSWARFVDGIWEGVYSDDARNARVLSLGPPGSPPEPLSGSAVASKYAWVYRNTTHGHHLDSQSFEKYLVRHNGIVPGSVRELAIALWLCLLACPQKFWPPSSTRFDQMEPVELPAPPFFSADPPSPVPPTEAAGTS